MTNITPTTIVDDEREVTILAFPGRSNAPPIPDDCWVVTIWSDDGVLPWSVRAGDADDATDQAVKNWQAYFESTDEPQVDKVFRGWIADWIS